MYNLWITIIWTFEVVVELFFYILTFLEKTLKRVSLIIIFITKPGRVFLRNICQRYYIRVGFIIKFLIEYYVKPEVVPWVKAILKAKYIEIKGIVKHECWLFLIRINITILQVFRYSVEKLQAFLQGLMDYKKHIGRVKRLKKRVIRKYKRLKKKLQIFFVKIWNAVALSFIGYWYWRFFFFILNVILDLKEGYVVLVAFWLSFLELGIRVLTWVYATWIRD